MKAYTVMQDTLKNLEIDKKANLVDSPGVLMWQISTLWRRSMSTALRPLNLSHPEFTILKTVNLYNENSEDLSQRRLSIISKLDVNVVSRLVRRMIQEDLVGRSHKENNDKTYFLSLTSKGKSLLEIAIPIVAKADKAFFIGLKEQGLTTEPNKQN